MSQQTDPPEGAGRSDQPKPAQPAQSDQPKPAQPAQPDHPEPEQPGQPDHPEPDQPGQPDHPEPDQPGQPDQPEPDQADRPGRISVGLLLCDHLDPEPAAVAGDYPVLYPAAFSPHGLDIRVYEATRGELPGNLDECDVWMVSGSRHSAYDDEPWISNLSDLIATAVRQGRPLAGICFGHQLAALALGGEVQRADAGWGVGGRTFEVVNPAPWMHPPIAPLDHDDRRNDDRDNHDRDNHDRGGDGGSDDGNDRSSDAARSTSPARFTILMSHRDQVTRLPDGAELVATADYCPVGAYRLGTTLFCVQGHPEFVPGLSATLMELRRDRIGSEVVDAGLASLVPPSPPLDQDLVAGWIAEFYRQALHH